jgi:hypothetical protein
VAAACGGCRWCDTSTGEGRGDIQFAAKPFGVAMEEDEVFL